MHQLATDGSRYHSVSDLTACIVWQISCPIHIAWPMWPMPLCTRRSTWDFFGYRWNVEMWKKNVDSVDGWVPCKARCPAVVSPGHFSLLKSSQNHFQLPARWLASVFASEITSTKVPSTAARCKAAEASWLRCQTNPPEKNPPWKKNRSSGLLACLLIHRLTNPMWGFTQHTAKHRMALCASVAWLQNSVWEDMHDYNATAKIWSKIIQFFLNPNLYQTFP